MPGRLAPRSLRPAWRRWQVLDLDERDRASPVVRRVVSGMLS